jgi:hypothetical protein
MSVIAGIIGSILGRNREEGQGIYIEPSYHENAQQGVLRAWDDNEKKYVDMGTVGDLVQPGQMRQYNEGTGMYGDAPQQGGGFQNAIGKAGTIASLLQRLQRPQQGNQAYQMQIRR